MQEISLNNYNEMLRYEKDMDELRALALWITENKDVSTRALPKPREYVFSLIKYYSQMFANDIYSNYRIQSDSIDSFHSSLFSIKLQLNITDKDIERASEQQLYKNSGFWEMRRFIGQFGDIAECAQRDNVTHLITAATSGCIIGEYLGILINKMYKKDLPVDHMVFDRIGSDPVKGILPENFEINGNHVLLIDDALMETRTATVMIRDIKKFDPELYISILAVDIDPETKYSKFMNQFSQVYTFEE